MDSKLPKYYVIFGVDNDPVSLWDGNTCLPSAGNETVARWDFDNLVEALMKAIETDGEVRNRRHKKIWSAK